MDFEFTQEQVMLRNLTREFLARKCAARGTDADGGAARL